MNTSPIITLSGPQIVAISDLADGAEVKVQGEFRHARNTKLSDVGSVLLTRDNDGTTERFQIQYDGTILEIDYPVIAS